MTKGARRLLTVCAVLLGTVPTNTYPAAAQPPPGFPDFSGLPAVDADQYPSYTGHSFTTPDGLVCFGRGRFPYYSVGCAGTTVGSDRAILDMSTYARTDNLPATIYASPVAESATGVRPLPINHTIQMTADVVCAVLEPGTTACVLDSSSQTHGFVLSPERNWAF